MNSLHVLVMCEHCKARWYTPHWEEHRICPACEQSTFPDDFAWFDETVERSDVVKGGH